MLLPLSPGLVMGLKPALLSGTIFGGTPWTPPEVPTVINTELPEILSYPLVLGQALNVTGGVWSGDFDTIEVRLQETASVSSPGEVYLNWTSAPAGPGEGTVGKACYIAARAVKAGVPQNAVVNPTNYGPWQAFTEQFVAKFDFRGTYPGAGLTHDTEAFIVHAGNYAAYPTMSAIPQGNPAKNYGLCGITSGTPENRGTPPATVMGSRIGGWLPMSTSLNAFTCDLPNGWYRFRLIGGDPSGSSVSAYGVSLSVRNGTSSSSPELIAYSQTQSSGSLLVSGVETLKTTIAAWDPNDPAAGTWSVPLQVTNGAIRVQRLNSGAAGRLVCLDIKTSLPPG